MDQEKPFMNESLPDGLGSNRTEVMSREGPHAWEGSGSASPTPRPP